MPSTIEVSWCRGCLEKKIIKCPIRVAFREKLNQQIILGIANIFPSGTVQDCDTVLVLSLRISDVTIGPLRHEEKPQF